MADKRADLERPPSAPGIYLPSFPGFEGASYPGDVQCLGFISLWLRVGWDILPRASLGRVFYMSIVPFTTCGIKWNHFFLVQNSQRLRAHPSLKMWLPYAQGRYKHTLPGKSYSSFASLNGPVGINSFILKAFHSQMLYSYLPC